MHVHAVTDLSAFCLRPFEHGSDGHYRHFCIRIFVQALSDHLPASPLFGFGYLIKCLIKYRLMAL